MYLDTGAPKSINCIQVDGASDEGPSHEEVQYYWTERHLLKNKVATVVTTRSSSSSYLNRVELQNVLSFSGTQWYIYPIDIGRFMYGPKYW